MGERSTVLVVDDDASVLTLVSAVLKRDGVETIPCADPKQAVSIAAERTPDAIVLDLIMPGLSGFQVLEHLRRESATQRIPVLILSAKDESFDRVRGLKAGADDYLAKPFDPEELSIRLRRLIERMQRESAVVFSGRLGGLAAGDILQQALVSKMTGELELDGLPSGSITIVDGSMISAHCGELEGEAALIVLLQRREGKFRLVERPGATDQRGEPLSLNGALMLLAWIEDELERRRNLVPPLDAPLAAEETGRTPESECLHVDPVLDWFRNNQGANLAQLEETMLAAPQQLRLATVLLLEAGLLHLRDWTAPHPLPAPGPSNDPSRQRLDAACSRLVRRAEAMGRAPDVLHVLVGVDPERWEQFLDELVGGIPSSLVGRPREQLLAELRRYGSASLRIPCSDATLLLHAHRLSGLAGLRARAFLAMTTAVVLSPAAMPSAQAIDMLKATSALIPPPIQLVVPPQDGFEYEPGLFSNWHISERIPPTLEELLELLG